MMRTHRLGQSYALPLLVRLTRPLGQIKDGEGNAKWTAFVAPQLKDGSVNMERSYVPPSTGLIHFSKKGAFSSPCLSFFWLTNLVNPSPRSK